MATTQGGSRSGSAAGPADGPAAGSVGALGEFGLIDAVTAGFVQGPHVEVGPGDDAAVLRTTDGRVVASTDVLVDGIHFRRDWSTAIDVGQKAAAANLADIAAMGARPTSLLVGLALPADLPAAWVRELAAGFAEECALVGASVVGGDVVRSPVVTIAVTALGDLDGREPLTRAGARAGDLVAVNGRLGWSAAGLAVLSRGFRSPRVLVDAHRRPQPPYAAGPEAAVAGASAMCDVSDGLVADLGWIAAASGVHIDLDGSALQPDPPLVEMASALGVDAAGWVLGGGEDHALVATFPTVEAMATAGLDWHLVGRVTDAGETGPVVTVDGEPVTTTGGHDHFA